MRKAAASNAAAPVFSGPWTGGALPYLAFSAVESPT